MNSIFKKSTAVLLALLTLSVSVSPAARAANTNENEDVTSSNFSLIVCDGPNNPRGNPEVVVFDAQGNKTTRAYKVCDFNAAMREVQHIINILIIVGVLAALLGFSYSGFLYIYHGSEPSARSEAAGVFKKVFLGFIIMLTAWFVVYQILDWIQCKPGDPNCRTSGTSLLGNP